MQGVLKLPAWIGAAAKCGACINLCTLLLPGKNRGLYFRIGDTWCRHFVDVPTRPTRPQSLATAACNAFHSNMLQFKPAPKFNEMPQKSIKRPTNRKTPLKIDTSHTASILASKLGHGGLQRFSLKLPPSHRNLFFCFFLLSTKTPPTVIHGFMARKELLGLHAARLQGATKY